jgi:hypothetical protein
MVCRLVTHPRQSRASGSRSEEVRPGWRIWTRRAEVGAASSRRSQASLGRVTGREARKRVGCAAFGDTPLLRPVAGWVISVIPHG